MFTLKNHSIFFFILFSFICLKLNAKESFQYNVFSFYNNFDNELIDQSHTYALGTSFYFKDVSTKERLKHEAPFLERIGNLSFSYQLSNSKLISTQSYDSDAYLLHSTFMNPTQDYYFELAYANTNLKYDSPTDFNLNGDQYTIGAGWFFQKNLLVSIGYRHINNKYSGINVINNGITFKTNTYSLNAKYVKEMNEKGYSISSSLSQEKTDSSTLNESNTILNFLGNYFFNRSFSLGSGINYNVGEDKSDEGFTLSPRASIFITSLFHLDLLYSKFYADDPAGRNSDSYLIVIDHRF